jgi:hypothetical protein
MDEGSTLQESKNSPVKKELRRKSNAEIKLLCGTLLEVFNQQRERRTENSVQEIYFNSEKTLRRFSGKKEQIFGLKIRKEGSGESLVNNKNVVFATPAPFLKEQSERIFQKVSR